MACSFCGGDLGAGDPRRIYCSPLCRNRANYRAQQTRPTADHEHGTSLGYGRGCRCSECRGYVAAYSRSYRARQPKAPRKPRSDKGIKRVTVLQPERHGTASGYAWGCRCEACRKAAVQANGRRRKADPERHRRYFAQYRKANPDKVRGYSAARAAAPFDAEALAYCDILHGDPCVYCGSPADAVDHIDAVSISRDSRWTNLAAICQSCNVRKRTRTLLSYLAYVAA